MSDMGLIYNIHVAIEIVEPVSAGKTCGGVPISLKGHRNEEYKSYPRKSGARRCTHRRSPGCTGGSTLGGALTGILTGATAGTIFGPGVGNIVGAVIGGLGGGITGGLTGCLPAENSAAK